MGDQKAAVPAPKMASSKQRIMPSRKEKQDISIMETNNSCIVSKRSVERIYHKDDHGFLRYFVKKFQRRSPLINRGYWLRMRAIEHVVRTFLEETTGRRRTVINLGCGYDPLPFNFLSRDAELCREAVFVDVDYKQLMGKKCEMVRQTPELRTVIGLEGTINLPKDGVMIDRPNYKAVACDLEDMPGLDKVLTQTLDSKGDPVLFLAEVSITYMDALAAEKLVEWASTFNDACFAVLEQYLPDGENHPFAVTMLKHFQKLNSPLKTAIRHPSAEEQKRRFIRGSWKEVNFRSLWSLWSDDEFISAQERNSLDTVEPFDEWEEFALFCSHYFLLVARNVIIRGVAPGNECQPVRNGYQPVTPDAHPIHYGSHHHPSDSSFRRFGASHASQNAIWTAGGYGAQSRLESVDLLLAVGDLDLSYRSGPATLPSLPASLMCHTITPAGKGKQLLVGGRRSPSSASAACWLSSDTGWSALHPLPHGLYRHSAVQISLSRSNTEDGKALCAVLVSGGKTGPSQINEEWLMWTEPNGWHTLKIVGTRPTARFGASMVAVAGNSGYLSGGIDSNGTILPDLWSWVILESEDEITMQFQDRTSNLKMDASCKASFGRFGATLVISSTEDLLLVGGVTGHEVLRQDKEILKLVLTNSDIMVQPVQVDWETRPMLIGCTIELVNGSIVVAHGGAVCFSFGTYWNEGCWTVLPSQLMPGLVPWNAIAETSQVTKLANNNVATPGTDPMPRLSQHLFQSQEAVATNGAILEYAAWTSSEGVETILKAGQPVILRGLNVGTCTEKWTIPYLKEKVGAKRPVVVHSANSSTMNFLAKDFAYTTMPFGTFLDDISKGSPMYLRALSSDQPSAKPTTLAEDFPTLAPDFQLPPKLSHVVTNMHSSPLRIGGNVNMWLHFDVMANIYCQVTGEKQFILFPPSDVAYLDFPAGASSSRLDIFDAQGQPHYPRCTSPITFDLKPGDVLYIPPLWLHTAKPTAGVSVAVNVFFRNMQCGYAAGKDVYGNRDLQAYENGRRDVTKIAKAFQGLPEEVRRFYLVRLAKELETA